MTNATSQSRRGFYLCLVLLIMMSDVVKERRKGSDTLR